MQKKIENKIESEVITILTCKLGNEIINCYDGIHDKEQLKKWTEKKILLCPICNKPYEYCHGKIKTPYFRHMEKMSCDYQYNEPETEEHLKGKRDLFEWIKKQPNVKNAVLEGWIPETKQRPDIMFEYKNKKYVIEYQCSPISTDYIERHELYDTAGINVQKSRAKTEEQFRKELAEKQPNLIPNDKYINSETKYHCICKIHNVDVYKTPQKYLYRNQGCNLCAIERSKTAIRYTDESYSELLEHYNPTLEKLSEFKGVKKRINLRCKICGYEWNPIAETTIGENHLGCPKCAGNAIKTPEEFREELKISHPYLILKSDYIRSNIPIKVHCTRCGSDYEITPNKLQQGQQCLCYKESHSEFKTRIWLTEHNIKFEKEVTFDNLVGISEERQLSYDFYVPKYNTLIECQGEQHDHEEDNTGK